MLVAVPGSSEQSFRSKWLKPRAVRSCCYVCCPAQDAVPRRNVVAVARILPGTALMTGVMAGQPGLAVSTGYDPWTSNIIGLVGGRQWIEATTLLSVGRESKWCAVGFNLSLRLQAVRSVFASIAVPGAKALNRAQTEAVKSPNVAKENVLAVVKCFCLTNTPPRCKDARLLGRTRPNANERTATIMASSLPQAARDDSGSDATAPTRPARVPGDSLTYAPRAPAAARRDVTSPARGGAAGGIAA
ncbi:hypothetical protein ON010_g11811 [Phytophthora cinnamomi]|nr:hypothetical protein ON010_g11811 [Phytophthora cinnamomi]